MTSLLASADPAVTGPGSAAESGASFPATEKQVTRGPAGRILTNTGVWSPDGEWIVYDTRSDAAGDLFDGNTIEMVHVPTGEVREVHRAGNGAHCGVATFHPQRPAATDPASLSPGMRVVFILGPQNPTPEWSYNAWHRQGVIVDCARPNRARNLDARDLTAPFTPGALRGGSHVHVWDPKGDWVSFTYEDHILASRTHLEAGADINQRNVGVGAPIRAVRVPNDHPRNHHGDYFSVLVTRTVANPAPGSDEISRAFEEGWVGTNGYARPDGSRQRHALAFQGQVTTASGQSISEVFIVDLPEDPTREGDGPLAGTETRRPSPPKGTSQRRLTFSAGRGHPGLQGPRHWLRSSPDGSRIAFLMRDGAGVVQLHTVSPNGGAIHQITRNGSPISSAFTWSPDGRRIAHTLDHSVCVTDARTGQTVRLTPRRSDPEAPRPEACVFSPDGTKVAYVRRIPEGRQVSNQIFVATIKNL